MTSWVKCGGGRLRRSHWIFRQGSLRELISSFATGKTGWLLLPLTGVPVCEDSFIFYSERGIP